MLKKIIPSGTYEASGAKPVSCFKHRQRVDSLLFVISLANAAALQVNRGTAVPEKRFEVLNLNSSLLSQKSYNPVFQRGNITERRVR